MKKILLLFGCLSLLFSCENVDNGITYIYDDISSQYLLDGIVNNDLDTYVDNNQIVRLTGKPGVTSISIGSADLSKYEPCFVLYVITGTTPETTVSSAIIKVDDMVVLNTSDFHNDGVPYSFEVCNLTENSALTVEVKGQPGSYVNVWIEGKLKELTDCEGNVYKTVTIGNQVWMAENLRSTKYNDCTPIPHLQLPYPYYYYNPGAGFTWYNDDENNKYPYGALYTWDAVRTGKLCPVGWHVPSDEEWMELETYIGIPYDQLYGVDAWRGTDQGVQLRSKTGWDNDANGTDLYGFNAFPAGQVTGDGVCKEFGYATTFHTSSITSFSIIDTWRRHIHIMNPGIQRYYTWISCGYSVRCVKD